MPSANRPSGPVSSEVAEDEQRETAQAAAKKNAATIELSVRQRQVLLLLWEGATNRTIAQRLNLAESTVNVHVSGLMKKLGARSRTQAVILSSQLLGLNATTLWGRR